ncbi:hypothetical protein C8R45DRAFT_617581 [Mycena sanguinolenta]|nr:hypothetical protein C8R45DRAFT_617581 [Mycena sanguinolenta]
MARSPRPLLHLQSRYLHAQQALHRHLSAISHRALRPDHPGFRFTSSHAIWMRNELLHRHRAQYHPKRARGIIVFPPYRRARPSSKPNFISLRIILDLRRTTIACPNSLLSIILPRGLHDYTSKRNASAISMPATSIRAHWSSQTPIHPRVKVGHSFARSPAPYPVSLKFLLHKSLPNSAASTIHHCLLPLNHPVRKLSARPAK